MEKPLTVKNLNVVLDGYSILEDISFEMPSNSIMAIIGPNGAGKSVLLKCILKLLPKQSGEINIFGINHNQYRKVAPLVSYIPQYVNFDHSFPLTVEGLFTLKSSRPLGLSGTERQRMKDLLSLVGATKLLSQKLSVLSGGQLQRVILAYSMMDQPKLLLLDEPAAGIDVQGQETIYPLLVRIHQEENLNIVIVSHELQIVLNFATQVLCLNKKLMCSGIPHKVLTNETLQAMYGTEVGHFLHNH